MPIRTMCHRNQLPGPGLLLEFTLDGRPVCVANNGGSFVAVEGLCPHRGAPLAEGSLQDGQLLCPWHAWQFDLATGVESTGCASIDIYAIEMDADEVRILLPE